MKILHLIIISLLVSIISCKADEPVKTDLLVSTVEVRNQSAEEIKKRAESVYGPLALMVNMIYAVSVRKIIYHTTYKGKRVKASGVIFIPSDIKRPLNLLSIQHGTIFHQNEAPGNTIGTHSEYEMLASSGIIIFVPDYIGYGESSGYFHPYFDYHHSSASVVDMLKAGVEFLYKENIKHTGKVILTGYSEGGYVTLAAHKKLEEKPVNGITVSASAAGAGGYDLLGVLNKSLLEKGDYPAPAYLAFVLMAYNHTYDWKRPLSDFFEKKWALQLPEHLYGSHYGSTINSMLTNKLDELFTPAFFKDLRGPGEMVLKAKLAANSVHDWKPAAPVRLYHGTSDEIIPYATSVTTYNNFLKHGSEAELITIENGTHGSSFLPMLISVIEWLEDFE